METFKEFIELNEIGTGTKPYPWKFNLKLKGHYKALFKVNDTEVIVLLRSNFDGLDIEFFTPTTNILEPKDYSGINASLKELLRTMSTVVEITKQALQMEWSHGEPWYQLMFAVEGKGKKGAATKLKLYKEYIKHSIKNVKVKQLSSGVVFVRLPKDYYENF